MKRIQLPALLLVLLTFVAFLPSDTKDFPKISGTTLSGKNITLPDQSRGRFILIAVIRTMKAEQEMITWIEPIYNSIAGNSMFQADMYFIPMTGGIQDVS